MSARATLIGGFGGGGAVGGAHTCGAGSAWIRGHGTSTHIAAMTTLVQRFQGSTDMADGPRTWLMRILSEAWVPRVLVADSTDVGGSIDVKEFATIVRDIKLLVEFDENEDGVLDAKELLRYDDVPAAPKGAASATRAASRSIWRGGGGEGG